MILMLVDQNACSSPHLILWKGRFNLQKQRKSFGLYLNTFSKKKYDSPPYFNCR